MFRLIIVVVLIQISSTLATPDDSFDDEPLLYMEARASKYRSAKPLQSKDNFYRYARAHGDTFLPLEDVDTEFEEFTDEFARPTRSQEKNDNFVRFGRGNSDFIRFGRDPYKYNDQNFLRFGRSVSESETPKKRSRRDVVGESKTKRNNRENFLRFGRGGDDSFIRYGRNHEGSNIDETLPVPTKSHPNFIHGQSLLNYPFAVNGRLLHNSPLLSILRKLEEEMRQNN